MRRGERSDRRRSIPPGGNLMSRGCQADALPVDSNLFRMFPQDPKSKGGHGLECCLQRVAPGPLPAPHFVGHELRDVVDGEEWDAVFVLCFEVEALVVG